MNYVSNLQRHAISQQPPIMKLPTTGSQALLEEQAANYVSGLLQLDREIDSVRLKIE